MNISSILPAFNEETNITTAISSIIIIFKKLKIDQWELIVVNDGSSDKTKELVEEAILQESRVKIINHSKNKGYGETLYSGLDKAQYDWIFITDSDLQFFIEDLILLVEKSKNFNFVQGIREKRNDPMFRILLGKIYRKIVHQLFKIPVIDPECSFRLFQRFLIKDSNIVCKGPMVPVELILNANNKKATFTDVPVRHRSRKGGETKALSFKSFTMLFRDFTKLILKTYFNFA